MNGKVQFEMFWMKFRPVQLVAMIYELRRSKISFLKQDCAAEITGNKINNPINKDGSKITHYTQN